MKKAFFAKLPLIYIYEILKISQMCLLSQHLYKNKILIVCWKSQMKDLFL